MRRKTPQQLVVEGRQLLDELEASIAARNPACVYDARRLQGIAYSLFNATRAIGNEETAVKA